MFTSFQWPALSARIGTATMLTAALLTTPLGSAAAPVPPSQDAVPYTFATPPALQAQAAGVVASHDVRRDGASWLRVVFGDAALPGGAVLRLTSLQDGAQQHLNATTLAQWRQTSAYFNGPAVRVELLAQRAGPAGGFAITQVMAGKPQAPAESQCGPTDDRVASNVRDRGRFDGCTANLMTKGCVITAGHCMTNLAGVLEFNVPRSNADGSLNHPPPKHQYVLTNNHQSSTASIGDDWGVFTVAPNSETGLTPLEAQGSTLRLARALPALGDKMRIHGYGVDTGSDNQTQQRSVGTIVGINHGDTLLDYQADTEGGNSGSAVLSGRRVVAIHTLGGCSTDGSGSNSGTLFNNPNFKKAFREVCAAVD